MQPFVVAVLLAAPRRPDVAALLDAALQRSTGRPLSLLLVGDGVSWADDPGLRSLIDGGDVDAALCSRSARDRGRSAATTPAVRWSSVVGWVAALPADAWVWSALP